MTIKEIIDMLLTVPLVGVLIWFMFVVYPQQNRLFILMEHRNRVIALLILALADSNAILKSQAEQLIKDIDNVTLK
jgi:hypothetical protein